MPTIRHKTTLHQITVPDGYNPAAYPNYEPVTRRASAAPRKRAPRKRAAKRTAPTESTPTE